MDDLVSTEWLAGAIGAADLRIVDATWFLPSGNRDARAEFEAAHVPGAAFLDIGAILGCDTPVVGKLPPGEVFGERVAALGIGAGDRVVVYDNSPLHTAARAWFLLKAYGVEEVAILDGGLGKWRAEGRPVESGPAASSGASLSASLDRARVMAKDEVAALVHSGEHEIVDARGPARFAGEEAEPRPDVTPGHIPGARNVPYASLYNEDGTFKRGEALRSAFEDEGVDLGKPMIATCGSGVTACSLAFGAHLLGKRDVRLYDGSWAEWGCDPSLPKETGRA